MIKKDGSKEVFNVQKVINAVGKSAYRALTKFTREEEAHICQYVVDKVNELESDEIPIPIMHNIVESALEQVKPIVAKSYRDYRNYKQDFVRMLDDVYKKSQSIMYIGDKENANTDSALVSTKRSLIFNPGIPAQIPCAHLPVLLPLPHLRRFPDAHILQVLCYRISPHKAPGSDPRWVQ